MMKNGQERRMRAEALDEEQKASSVDVSLYILMRPCSRALILGNHR